MGPKATAVSLLVPGRPRVSGDGPKSINVQGMERRAAPRERGWAQGITYGGMYHPGGPA